jgi:tetratricopeptide (TPR) repeat protein
VKDEKKKTEPKIRKQTEQKNKPVKKSINPVKLVYTIVLLIIFGGIILYLSGVFDQPSGPAVTQQMPNDEFHRGADLSKLQEINRLRDQVTNNPADHEAILHLAHLLNDSGFKQEAIKWYRQYLQDHPDIADVWVDMGVCYFDMNDFDNAISSMKKGIELDSKHQIAHFNLGIVNYTKGNLKEAMDWWNKAIELNPSSDIASRARELIKNNTNM